MTDATQAVKSKPLDSTQGKGVNDAQGQPASAPQQAPVAPKVPAPPAITPPAPGKEQEPPAPHLSPSEMKAHDTAEADTIAAEEGDEFWKEYAQEIETELEIKEMGGVEKVASGEVQLPEEIAKEMGVKPVYDVGPAQNKPTVFSIKGLSLSDDQLSQDIIAKEDTAVRWLAEWFIYQLKKAHYQVKVVKGKVLREEPGQHTPPQKPKILKTSLLGKFKVLPIKALGHGTTTQAASNKGLGLSNDPKKQGANSQTTKGDSS